MLGRSGSQLEFRPRSEVKAMKKGNEQSTFRPDDVASLAERLAETLKALESLMAGEADTVLGPGGESFLLLSAQDSLRDSEAVQRQIAEVQLRLNLELEQRVAERTEQLQKANQELEAAIRELREFTYSVSHDLRAPLRHVGSFAELVRQDSQLVLSEKSLRYLGTITKSAEWMGKLIDGLLSFSRIGQLELQLEDVNLNELVGQTVQEFQAQTKQRKIVWTIHPLEPVRADRELLRLVFVSLISNAVKFTSTRHEARIEIGPALSANSETVIFVRDNGAGFDPKYTEKLFGVFRRLHSREEFEGAGIGLASVQRIITLHGGRTWAEGMVEEGATFHFSIPTRDGAVTE
jgi:light-regulated signal transduction histidine kinase (bacteriophytochrome)